MSDPRDRTHVCDTCRDKPGSDTAAAKGCTCPRCERLFLPCSCPTSLAGNIARLIRHDVDGCCEWAGAISGGGQGYGYVRFGGAAERAHRVVFRHARGPVRDGMVLHHLCGNTRCVKPDHLLECTQEENAGFERPEFCLSGRHEMSVHRMNDGHCRVCHKERERRRNWKKRGEPTPLPGTPEAEWLACLCPGPRETSRECPVHQDYHACEACYMRPGSDSAVQIGCICPRLDSGRGHNTERAVVVIGCPVHCPEGEADDE